MALASLDSVPELRLVRVVFAETKCDSDGCSAWRCPEDERFWTGGRWLRCRQYVYAVPEGMTVEVGDEVFVEDGVTRPTVVGFGQAFPHEWPGPYKEVEGVCEPHALDVSRGDIR